MKPPKLISTVASLIVIVVAAFVVIGWATDTPLLKSVWPGLVAMNPASAVCFILCGMAVLLLAGAPGRRKATLAGGLALVAVAASFWRVAGYIFDFDPVVDRLLFSHALEQYAIPNRMPPNTALGFLLLSVAVFSLSVSQRRSTWIAHLLCVPALCLAFLTLTGYAYGYVELQRFRLYIPMALHTALGIILLSAAILFTRIEHGPFRLFVTDGIGGRLLRSLLPAALMIPLGLGWLRLQGEKSGLFGVEVGVAIMALSTTLLLAVLIWWTAVEADRADAVRRASEAELDRTNAALASRSALLEEANRELEAFSYSVSHDLRAPLRTLDGFSRALLEDYGSALEAPAQDYLRRIMAAAQRMGRLIDDLLSLARVARADMRREPVDLTSAAQSIVTELQQAEPNRRIEVCIAPQLSAYGDRALLRVVLQNLLSNAWKFTGRTAHPRITFEAHEMDGRRVFAVRDNGAGFDMTYATKLFGPFQRLHSTSEYPGTGIGLATVQRIIVRHGGRIWVDAAVERGANFYFTIEDGNGNDDSVG